jgi:hypothetical protein
LLIFKVSRLKKEEEEEERRKEERHKFPSN